MGVPKTQYNIKEEKDHIIYTRKYSGITVNNKFPRVASDTEKRLEALRYLAAQMIMEKLEE
ncbi:hypothetical protein MGLY_28420 [Neomoorella glycerini]|uniref:Uncharacterized protein n=1 Tax=Neomoorella glycerini TaxID=55779 RepID=A0A6I5ZU36_9FIRM|nr:hypothetical protein [Moorella glycerini]QGP93434.1 hypothetical protein MGLY_28420 [Moorella glycerini]